MSRQNLNDVIQEAVCQDQPSQGHASATPPANNPLAKARDQLKRSTKLYAASGIVEG